MNEFAGRQLLDSAIKNGLVKAFSDLLRHDRTRKTGHIVIHLQFALHGSPAPYKTGVSPRSRNAAATSASQRPPVSRDGYWSYRS